MVTQQAPKASAFSSGFKGAIGVIAALVFLPIATCGGCVMCGQVSKGGSDLMRGQ